jgi:hypothetical protein
MRLFSYALAVLYLLAPGFPGDDVSVATPVRAVDVHQVDVGKLAEVVESVIDLWKLPEGQKSGRSDLSAEVAVLTLDSRTKRLLVKSANPQLVSRIEELVHLIDRTPEQFRESGGAARPAIRGSVFKGKRVDILEGRVPVKELLRFLADYTGLPTIVAGEPQGGVDAVITVAAAIRDADAAVVQALLEANGWLLERRKLPGDREILEVTHTSWPKSTMPRSMRIIRIEEKSDSEKPDVPLRRRAVLKP